MRGRLVSLLLGALLALPLPALAGGIYKCAGSDGVDSYVSKRLPGAQCKLVGSYRAGRASKPRKASKPVATAAALPVAVAAKAPATAPVTAAAAPRVVRGQVYAFVDADGVRNYTSVRPAGLPAASVRTINYSYIEKCYACGALPGLNFRTLRLNTVAFQDEIRAAALEHGVDESIVRAIIHAESAFNPRALSRVGAQGLMQLMPATASRFGVSNAFDAAQNIRGGVRYLAWLLKRFDGNLTLAAAGYNAGEGAVDKYGGVPPYNETQRYVQRVALLAERYRGVLNPVASPLRGGLSAR
ncbi:lytic transglycosylase domain-containing protein [Thermomonas sp. XSG]|jgi:soluble lytic murein transglycosylase-like protein|uniref:lytic transglycosylase domain-containing protein n=1 Tax=Thermomonas sp. XSG TaxID=2771436 RepID=UPI0016809346|nr:lytic transglycosylase domain-containing protein [Thermomonas sp. XSG]QNU14284.1 lytic transglycosylase domain-containing protein [Thermomonas sp. XSG]